MQRQSVPKSVPQNASLSQTDKPHGLPFSNMALNELKTEAKNKEWANVRYRRPCCPEKENFHEIKLMSETKPKRSASKDSRGSKRKTKTKTKFLQTQLEKLLEKKYAVEKVNQQEFSSLRENFQEMKNLVGKLTDKECCNHANTQSCKCKMHIVDINIVEIIAELTEKKKEISDLLQKYKDVQGQMVGRDETIAILRREREEMQRNIKIMMEQNAKVKKLNDDNLEDIKQKYESQREKIKALSVANANSMAENERLKVELTKMSTAKMQITRVIQSEKQQANEKHEKWKQMCKVNTEMLSEIDTLQSSIANLTLQLSQSNKKNTQLTETITHLQDGECLSRTAMVQLQKSMNQSEERYRGAQSTLASLRIELTAAVKNGLSQAGQLQQNTQSVAHLQSQLQIQTEELLKEKKVNQQILNELENIQTERTRLREKLSETCAQMDQNHREHQDQMQEDFRKQQLSQAQHARLQNQLDLVSSSIKAHQDSLAAKDQYISTRELQLQGSIQQLTFSLTETQTTLKDRETLLSTTQTNLNQTQTALAKALLNIQEEQAALTLLQTELSSSQASLNEFQGLLSAAQANLTEKENYLIGTQASLKASNEALQKSKNEVAKKEEDYLARITATEKELSQSASKITELKEVIKAIRAESISTQQEVRAYKVTMDQLEDEKSKADQICISYLSQVNKLREEIQSQRGVHEAEVAMLNATLQSLRAERQMQGKQLLQMQDQLWQQAENHVLKYQAFNGDHDLLCREVAAKHAIIQQKDTLLQTCQAEQEEVKNRLHEQENCIQSLRSEVQGVSREMVRWKKTAEEKEVSLQTFRGENERLGRQIAYQLTIVEQKEAIIRAMQTEKDNLIRDMANQTCLLADCNKQIDSLRQDKYRCVSKLEEQRRIQVQHSNQQQDRLTSLLKEAKDNIISNDHHINQLERTKLKQDAKISELQQFVTKFKNEIHSNQNKISNIYTEREKQNQTQSRCVEELKKISQSYREQIIRLEEKLQKSQKNTNQNEEKHKKQLNEIYDICDTRKNEVVYTLKAKIKQLSEQNSALTCKINTKNTEFAYQEQKMVNLHDVLNENHALLNAERQERGKLVSQIDSLHVALAQKQEHLRSLEENLIAHRNDSQQSTARFSHLKDQYEQIKREVDSNEGRTRKMEQDIDSLQAKIKRLQQENLSLLREIEHLQSSSKVLRQENVGIERIMSEQIQQHKDIIEQLMGEKKILYSQLATKTHLC